MKRESGLSLFYLAIIIRMVVNLNLPALHLVPFALRIRSLIWLVSYALPLLPMLVAKLAAKLAAKLELVESTENSNLPAVIYLSRWANDTRATWPGRLYFGISNFLGSHTYDSFRTAVQL